MPRSPSSTTALAKKNEKAISALEELKRTMKSVVKKRSARHKDLKKAGKKLNELKKDTKDLLKKQQKSNYSAKSNI